MPARHIAFDETLMLWDATDTSGWTFGVGTYYSSDINLATLRICDAYSPNVHKWGVAISWPGVGSAGAATFAFSMCSGAAATPTDVIFAGPTGMSLAAARAMFRDREACVFPIPTILTLAYFRCKMVIGVADLNAGVLTAGLVPLQMA